MGIIIAKIIVHAKPSTKQIIVHSKPYTNSPTLLLIVLVEISSFKSSKILTLLLFTFTCCKKKEKKLMTYQRTLVLCEQWLLGMTY